ncbi:hypothetical protein LF817_13230 [Halobacillus sp. A1]|uniref:hypothetical protein n=1 Tax=Halobacillus sp. A1 TaxID=2880262 RepID=UPI0020A6C067|nr:hypothetical protein [Halobacillus sp. A1]MCP3032304.1 hypothetical protein [Halobacillus sp. A1]
MKIIELIDRVYLIVILGALVMYLAGALNGEYLIPIVGGSFIIRSLRKFLEDEMTLTYRLYGGLGVFFVAVVFFI